MRNLIRFIYILLVFFFVQNNSLYAQCGFSTGEGCPNTDYENYGVGSSIPGTLEYDNFVSVFHATIARTYDGTFKCWGENIGNNGVTHITSPQVINSTNYPGLTGTPLKATAGSNFAGTGQFILLTTTGLFAWGNAGNVISTTIKSTNEFDNLTINSQTDGLPVGIDPVDVKMLQATYQTLILTTCSGSVYVLSQVGNARGNGNTGDSNTWYQVTTSDAGNPPLTNIVAARAIHGTVYALASDNTIWTWGNGSYLGDNNASATRTRATIMSHPNTSETIKMIGITGISGAARSYFVVMTNGKLYALGNNSNRQLGDWTTSERLIWVRSRYTSTSGPTIDNVKWLSAQEHDASFGSVNVINADSTQFAWGQNAGPGMIGSTTDPGYPQTPQGVAATDKIIAVETGGHTSMNIKKCTTTFGYVGHRTNGSMGDGTTGSAFQNSYTYVTAAIDLCGASQATISLSVSANASGNFCTGEVVNLTGTPSGGTFLLLSGPANLVGTTLTFTGTAGTVVVQYTVNNSCGIPVYTSINIPVAISPDAGTDQSFCGTAGSVNMSATGAGIWSLASGNPGTATIVTPSSTNTEVNSFSAFGTYKLYYTNAGSCVDSAYVMVNNCLPSWTLQKTSTTVPNNYDQVGDVLTYNIVVTNTGNVSISSVVVTDPTATSGPTYVSGDLGVAGTMEVGEVWNYTASRTINQANLDAGSYANTASVNGVPIGGTLLPASDMETIPAIQNPSIILLKTGTYVDNVPVGIYNAGDQITYAFSVQNTGNVTLTNVTVSDPQVTITGSPIASLAPGVTNTVSYTAAKTLTQTDIDYGVFTNTATVTGTPPIGPDVTDTDDDTQNFTQNPSVQIIKTGTYVDNAPVGIYNAGDQITYAFSVENTGNVTLTNISVSDPQVTISGSPIASLAPGAINTIAYSATKTLTQTDIDNGDFTNTATVNATPPIGPDVTDLDDDTQNFTQNPSVQIIKTGTYVDNAPVGTYNAGDQITYAFSVENTGNVTLTNVSVSDVHVTVSGSPIASLAPGFTNTVAYTATKTLTQTDIDNGVFINTATVTATPPIGPDVTDTDDDTQNFTQIPAIALTKASNLDLGVNGISNPSDIITYTYVVHNTGNVTLSNVAISEQSSSFTGTGILPLPVFDSSSLGSAEGILQVGESATYTALYAITQTDINDGLIYNQAMAEGQSPANVDVNDLSDSNNVGDPNETGNPGDLDENDPTGTYIPQTPIIGIFKTISSGPVNNNDGTYNLMYSIGVENMGNTTLYFVQVVEDLNQTFGGATSYSVLSVNSGDFAINPNFDGNTDTNLLTGADNLLVSGSGTITLSLTVTPGTNLGPYSNTAVATSEAPSGMPITDDSQDGTDVDPNNNDDPTDNDEPTAVTFKENPSIGIAKAITSGPINNNDGTYTLTYTILVENTGDVLLDNVQVVENLNTTFAGATSYTVNNISSTDFTVNNNFNGNTDTNLSSGTDNLIYQGSGSITLIVTVTPDSNLGAYNNTAVANGTSPANQPVTDDSQNGTDVDPDNNDDPTDNDEPTPITFTENPSIGIAKAITSGPINNNDGTYTLTYTMLVENTGDVMLSNVQVVENLNTTFTGVTSYTVNNLSSTDFSVNNNFNGNTDTNLLDGTDNLIYQGSGIITLTVTVTPGSNLGAYNNTAVANGTSPANQSVTDDSQNGTDVDPNNNDDPTDNDVPTSITFTENPSIGIAKAITSGPINNNDGTYTLTYTMLVENTGDVLLNNIQVVENLNTTFGGATSNTVNNISSADFSVNNNFNGNTDTNLLSGTDNLIYQGSGSITLNVTVTPGSNLGPYNNTAVANGNSPANQAVTDDSQNGTDVDPDNNDDPIDNDEPTPISFTESPSISVVKGSSLVLGTDAVATVGDIITYTYVVTNIGDVTLQNVTINEQIGAFTGNGILPAPVFVSASMGSSAGTILSGESATYTSTYALTQTDIDTGIVHNQVLVSGVSPSGDSVSDVSDSSNPGDVNETGNVADADENDATSTVIIQIPAIALTKASNLDLGVNGISNPDDIITYTYVVHNTGNVTLNNVNISEQSSSFTGTGILPLPVFGSSSLGSVEGILQVGESATYTAPYAITQTDINDGLIYNQAMSEGQSPSNADVNDLSDSNNVGDPNETGNQGDLDENDPTGTYLPQTPIIGISKTISSGPVNNNDGTYSLTYSIGVENMGNTTLYFVQVVENLNQTFSGATSYSVVNVSSGDFAVNPNFDGNIDTNLLTGTDNLLISGSGTITLSLTITPGANLGPYSNTAVAISEAPSGMPVTDDSQDGIEVDPDNNDDPTDNDESTPVTFKENPSIGIAKAITNGPINNNDGTYTLTYSMLVENTGDVLLKNVQVLENLNTTFAGATSYTVNNISSADFSVNNNFNGNTDTNLLAGTDNLIYQGSGNITLTVTVTPGSNLGAYNNTALVNGTSPANQSVTDDSQNGTDVDPDNNDDPTDNDEPTPVTFTENPSIGIAKAITSGPINNNDGTYTLTYTMLVENTGDVLLNNVQVVENLNTTFAGATSYTVNSISSTDFNVNNNFNGSSDTNLLDGTDNLIYQGSGSINLTMTVTPGSNLGAYNNTAVANGTSPANQSVTDDSQNGTDVDPNNNDDPTDNDEPTSVTFTENPSIGIAKAITSGPINNNDGTYTLTYTMLVENTGDVLLSNVQVVENLNTTFGGATSYTVNNIISADFSVNNNFNGNTDSNLLDGTDDLIYQGSGSITLTVTVTPGSNLGAYNNTAVANGSSPANQSVTDDSQNGTDVDPDNNDDPTDNDEPTSVTFTENPSIGIAKAITSGPINNNDGTYTLTYTMLVENTGDVLLSNVQVLENLNTTFSGATSYTVNNVSSTDFSVNNNFNGNTDTNLLDGTDNLIYQGSGSITLTVTITPGSNLGPYNNTAIANGTSPANQSVTDDSQNGTDVDPDNNDDPTDNDQPTAVTFTENPSIGIAKTITNGPINNNDGTYALTYTMLVENTGDVLLDNVQVVENLNTTFSGATSYTVNSISSTDFSVNNNFNGNTDTNLLSGTDNLIYRGSGGITLTVTVTPGSNLGAYNNTAIANGTSPANQSVTDDSQNGTDADPDNNDDPTDNDEPTSVTFTENPSIGIAKAITSGPININDGTYTLTYTMLVENTGDVLLSNVQVVENLNTTFAGSTSYTVNSISSTDFSVNNNFNGSSDTNLLDGTDNLIYQGSGSITLTVTVTPGSKLGAYNNTAVVNGTSPANQSVTDDSQGGTNVDPDNNDDPTDNDEPTSISFTENPNIGISKALTNGPINKGNQTYDLEFTMILQNTGDVPLSNVQVIDDLALTFAAAESFTINSVTTSANLTVNPLYNGTTNIQLLSGNDELAYNETGTITLSVNLRPGINITPFENIAIGEGISPAGISVSDDSQDGDDFDPDNDNNPSNNGDPTPIPIPAVAVLKDLTSSVLLPDGDVRLTFDLLVKNIGNVTMTDLILEDNLLMSTAFSSTPDFAVSLTNISANVPPSANVSYNGVTDINLITGNSNLAPAQEFSITLSFDVNPVLFSQLNNDFKKNQAVVFGTPRDQNGNVLLNPSTASFYNPREVFDASDDISGLVLGNIFDTNNGANGDGLGLNPYDNPTPITMPSSIKVLKAISATNPPVQLLNGNYRVTYDFDMINNGGQVLQSIQLEDDIAAQYGCAFVGNASVPLVSLINNSNLSVIPTVNNLFAGGGGEINMLLGDGILYPGDTIHLTTSLEIDPSCINPASPLENQAIAFAIDETESSVNDLSDDVTDINNDGTTDYPGMGLDDPTPLEIPSINVVKSLVNITDASSHIPGHKDVTYRFTIQNTGNTNLVGIDLIDQIQNQLAPVWVGVTTMPTLVLSTASVTPILNPNFNGGSQANMFNGTTGNIHPGQFVTVQLTIEIDPNKDNTYPLLTNQATTNGDVILGNGIQTTVTDASDDGINPKGINPNYLGDTGTSNDPTPLIVPAISTVKNVVSYQNALSGIEGHYDVVMNISVKNIGNVHLTNISLLDTIELTKYVGTYFVGLAPTTNPNIVNSNLTQNPTINNAFNGRLANSNIFDGNSGLMAPGQAFTVQLRLELDATLPGLPDSLWNRVSAYGDAAKSDGSLYYLVSDGDPITTSDDSDAGYDHESTNPNQPEDLGTSNDKTLIEVLGEIGDFVWNDLDGDGIQDEGEPGLANVVVELYDCNDQFLRSVTTDGNGAFALTNVLKGQYKLKFDFSNLGNGYAFTLPNVGNDALNSDANADGFTNCFTLNAGERTDDIDAGLVQLSSIGKFVWDDLNGDGLQSTSEPGISGVQVKIFLPDGTLVDSTITSSNGQYAFIGLYPGNYYLTFATPEGYSFTFANSGSNDAVDSDVNGVNGVGTTSVFTLLPGVTNNTLNAGMYRCIPIGDLVWYDLNRNDVWDSNENGINGLPVNLWRNVGGTWIIWDTKFTGFKPNSPSADGYFNFCAPPGQYYVEVIIPQLGLVRARPNIGNNEEIDSDLTNAFGPGTSASFTVTSGQQKIDLGAGYYPMAIAGNLVWQDDNQNGLQDDEEPKVAGVKVQAYDANTHLVVAEAITDEEGKYTLDYLERADIYIKFDVPSGFSPTIARAADDVLDSDVDHSFGPNTTRMFAMESGMVNENIDLGIAFGVLPVEWLDVNASRLNNTHIVSWRTAKEVNVAYYIVERRFANETVFTEIPGRVTVNGNTNAIQAYSLIDQEVAPSGVYIYRVKQVDFDGKYTYSKLVSVQNQGEDIITLYPNPAKGEANLEISLSTDGDVSIEIFDNTSKLVKVVATEQIQLQGVKSYPLNLQDMAAGIYNLKISINGVVTQKKLIRIE